MDPFTVNSASMLTILLNGTAVCISDTPVLMSMAVLIANNSWQLFYKLTHIIMQVFERCFYLKDQIVRVFQRDV